MGNLPSYCTPEGLFYANKFDAEYEIDESAPIGSGKFSEVYLCWKRNNPLKRYALKVIQNRCDDQAALARTVEEFNILQVLGSHAGIVQLVDRDDNNPTRMRFVLELCEGGELYDRVQQLQKYQETEAKILTANLLKAIQYIHEKGIMHRDLKPENILMVSKLSNTDIKISDFGLAKISKDYPRRLPRSHSICGSDFYLAPEVIKQEEYGREIDIWSVGVITFVLMSGALPFFHTVLHKLYRQIVERELVFQSDVWGKISKGCTDFIIRLLQVRPGDRLTAEQSINHPWLRNSVQSSSFNMGGTALTRDPYNTRDSGVQQSSQVASTIGSYTNQQHTYADFDDPRIGNNVNSMEHAHKGYRGKEIYGTPPPPPHYPHGGHPY